MARRIKDDRVTGYMDSCRKELENKLKGKAKVQFVAMGYKEKKPNGIYESTRVLSGKNNILNLIGLKVLDSDADGTMFLIVNYNPSYRNDVRKTIDEVCNPCRAEPVKTEEKAYSADPTAFDYYIDMLRSKVNHIRRLRIGRIKRTNGMYPDGIHICNTGNDGVGIVAVDKGYSMPIYLHTFEGMSKDLEKRLMYSAY